MSLSPKHFARAFALRRPTSSTVFSLLAAVLPLPMAAQGTGYWHTSGNRVMDANGATVRIAGINWYGFETTRGVAGGLTSQDYKAVLATIKTQGYNTVRIPLSNQMVETPQVPSSISFSNGSGAINTDLQGLNSLQILDKFVTQAGVLGLRVILDNHRSEAGDSAESNGLWFTSSYPESAWINDWTTLAQRYLNNPTVIGFDLRNEPHNAFSGGACWDCGGANDWHLAAERAGNAVLAVNPKLLIFVEGTDAYASNDYYWWGGNLAGAANSPVVLSVANQLVYSAHDYGPTEYGQQWFNGSTTAASLAQMWTAHWGYLAKNGVAPVWLGEFGTTNDAASVSSTAAGSEGQWFQSLVSYLQADGTLNWTYWALNGEDHYGLLDSNYDATPVSAAKESALQTIQFALNGGGGGTTPTPPVAPTGLTAKAASANQINLGWAASSSAGVTYTVYFGTASGSTNTVLASNVAATSYAATGLNASTTYFFTVKAVSSSAGSSAASNQASAATQAAPAGTCHVAYTDQNDWGSGFTGAVSITNSGTAAISSWTLTWSFPGNQQMTQSWNANYTQSGGAVALTSMSYNGSLAAGATVSGIGFNANYSGTNAVPAVFYLNGVRCQ